VERLVRDQAAEPKGADLKGADLKGEGQE